MDLNANFIALQSILRELSRTIGDFAKIKYKGGNEMKISHIVDGVKKYMINTFINMDDEQHSKEIQNMLQFLLINTKFEDGSLLNKEEFFHLINVIPILSKCILANLIIELKLTKHYCGLMRTLPVHLNSELLHEIVPCLKVCEPQQALEDTFNILTALIKHLSTLNLHQNEEIAEKLGDVAAEMLKNISGINPDLIQNWKKSKVHKHIGYSLLYSLQLLKNCPLYEQHFSRIANSIIQVTTSVMKVITVDVFCDWAEVKYEDDQPLQTVIAGAAYLVVEYLQKYKPAKELIQMLGSIAKKPKTINEIILEADQSTIICSINKCDRNQKLWFKAFMGTNVLQTEESLACLNKWSHLCIASDITRLLNKYVFQKEPRFKAVIIKCAHTLSVEELSFVIARYFREYNVNHLNTESVKEQLTTTLNKTHTSSEVEENFIKEILILVLQNPTLVLNSLYTECIKKGVNTQRLQATFKHLKDAVEVNNLSKTVFIQVLKSYPPTSENVLCYKELLNILLAQVYFEDHRLINEIFTPQLKSFFDEDNNEILLYTLQVLNLISIKFQLTQAALPTIVLLENIMEKMRCQFLTFSNFRQQIVQESASLMVKYSSQHKSLNLQYKDYLDDLKLKNHINEFYVSNLYHEEEMQLLEYVYPTLDMNNYPEAISRLIKLLPSCVTSEWILITNELISRFGYHRSIQTLHDVLLLLCQIASTQSNNSDNTAVDGLQFCLQQYEVIIKEILQPKYASVEDEKMLIKNICNLLKHIPKNIRKEEGLQLTKLLSSQSLHSLKEDREFVLSLIAIEDTDITQSLAQKMLS